MTDKGSIQPTTVGVDQIIDSTRQNLIMITEDKLRLLLYKYEDSVEKRRSFWAPLGILITIVITIFTADFKDLGLSSEVWHSCFIVSGLALLIYSICLLKRALQTKKQDIMEIIRSEAFSEGAHDHRVKHVSSGRIWKVIR